MLLEPHLKGAALGNGSHVCGGAPSRHRRRPTAGRQRALRLASVDLPSTSPPTRSVPRSTATPPKGPFDRRAGLGWVAATATKHDYADAQGKGNHVLLLITEKSSAMHRDLVRAIHELGVQARLDPSEDSTQYGPACTSPSSFFAHHLANISAAVVYTQHGRAGA